MTLLYADFICPVCQNEDKQMHEIKDGKKKMLFPGDAFLEERVFEAECGYCDGKSKVHLKVTNNKFAGFANENELTNSKYKNDPDKGEVFEKWKGEKTFSPSERFDFKKQPFKPNTDITLNNEKFSIEKVYQTEWVEKDVDIRLDHPRPDIYWYELRTQSGLKRWLKVENVEGDNVFLSDKGIVVMDKEDMVEDITHNPTKIKVIYKDNWFGGREIEAYQYVNGVRIIVLDHKKRTEMDIFEDTFEEAMEAVEENMELGVFNE
ncbi:hypothetical protein C1N61_30075 (plasmid) [Priestia aryabhattai]